MMVFFNVRKSFYVFWVPLAIAFSCRKGMLFAPLPGSVYYFNSFESTGDATGWNGVLPDMFVLDPAPGAGEKSLQIGGGCIQPTAWRVFPKAESDAWYRLSCWGKIDQENQSGQVVLKLEGDDMFSMETALHIKGRSWTFYQSNATLFCPRGKQLRIDLMVGGIIFASMHLDGLTIEKTVD